MASSLGSLHHIPSLEVSSSGFNRRITLTTPTSCLYLPFPDKSQFNTLVVAGRPLLGFKRTFVPRAVATPNSVLSEQAFKGLSLQQDQDEKDVSDSPGEAEAETSSNHDDEELDISRLGLPQRLVDSLLKRGITHLFPIQVNFSLFINILTSILILVLFYLQHLYSLSSVLE